VPEPQFQLHWSWRCLQHTVFSLEVGGHSVRGPSCGQVHTRPSAFRPLSFISRKVYDMI